MRIRMPLLVRCGLAAVLCLALWTWGVLPARNYMNQRTELANLQAELAEIRSENAALQDEIVLLGSDAEIERIARSDFGLVYPGEEAYAILPSAETSSAAPG